MLGSNALAWDPNVETDLAAYRIFRARLSEAPALLADVAADSTRYEDAGVGAGEFVTYTILAIDRDGLESHSAEWVEVESDGYELSATAGPDSVRIEWNARESEGYRATRLTRSEGILVPNHETTAEGGRWVDRDVKSGHRYRYEAVLLGSNGVEAPPSRPIEVWVPEAGDFR